MKIVRPTKSRTKRDHACQFVRKDGDRCEASHVARSKYCYFHDPDLKAERRAAQSAGGQKSKPAVLPSSTPDVKLENADDDLKLLAATINQVRRGEIDPKIANAVGYLVSLRSKVRFDAETERRLAPLESVIKTQKLNGSLNANDEEDPEWNSSLVKENGDH